MINNLTSNKQAFILEKILKFLNTQVSWILQEYKYTEFCTATSR